MNWLAGKRDGQAMKITFPGEQTAARYKLFAAGIGNTLITCWGHCHLNVAAGITHLLKGRAAGAAILLYSTKVASGTGCMATIQH
jgi:hypothetical protein